MRLAHRCKRRLQRRFQRRTSGDDIAAYELEPQVQIGPAQAAVQKLCKRAPGGGASPLWGLRNMKSRGWSAEAHRKNPNGVHATAHALPSGSGSAAGVRVDVPVVL